MVERWLSHRYEVSVYHHLFNFLNSLTVDIDIKIYTERLQILPPVPPKSESLKGVQIMNNVPIPNSFSIFQLFIVFFPSNRNKQAL